VSCRRGVVRSQMPRAGRLERLPRRPVEGMTTIARSGQGPSGTRGGVLLGPRTHHSPTSPAGVRPADRLPPRNEGKKPWPRSQDPADRALAIGRGRRSARVVVTTIEGPGHPVRDQLADIRNPDATGGRRGDLETRQAATSIAYRPTVALYFASSVCETICEKYNGPDARSETPSAWPLAGAGARVEPGLQRCGLTRSL